jgi:hypothetical protein
MNTLDKLSEEYESGILTTKAGANTKKPSPPPEWNLLHRLLRIKPECRVLVVCHSRRVTRNIFHQLMVAEEARGIKDMARDHDNRNCYTGRLDKDNVWGMKPVWFAIEHFTIINSKVSKSPKLTAVRFTQTRGSAQSLRRLVELLGAHLQEDHLHNNAKETGEIVNMIRTGRADTRD